MEFNTQMWAGGSLAGAPVSFTARRLIYKALRDLQVLRAGMTPNADIVQDGLDALNDLVDSWSIERLMVPYLERNEYELEAGKTNYDGTIPRPVRIDGASIIRAGKETPIEVLTRDRYLMGLPGVYNDGGFATSFTHVSPAPIAGDRLTLYTWLPFGGFGSDLDVEVSFPPGYARALRWNLGAELIACMALSAKFQPHLRHIETNAIESKGHVKHHNLPVEHMKVDPALTYSHRYSFDINNG